jgi:GAF domain-containing protein
MSNTIQRDTAVRAITSALQAQLQADRVVLYYFFRHWKGQVVCEALSDPKLTILGSTGADDCFNDEYAALYEGGRVRAIADIMTAPIHECHRNFLQSIQVRANLAVPILVPKGHGDYWWPITAIVPTTGSLPRLSRCARRLKLWLIFLAFKLLKLAEATAPYFGQI